MVISVTPIYAALLTFFYIFLSLRIAFVRRRERISLGDADDPALRTRIRVHANFVEYAPFGLLLLLLIEIQGGHLVLLHVTGLMLLIGRVGHAWGLSQYPQSIPLRSSGMVLTFSSMSIAALANLWLTLF